MPSFVVPSLTFRNVLLLSTLIRVALILYSEWHDARSVVKYTDVDYRVFSDAAAFLLHPGPGGANRAQGPWKDVFGYLSNIGECVSLSHKRGEIYSMVYFQSLYKGDLSIYTATCAAPHAKRMAAPFFWEIYFRFMRHNKRDHDIPAPQN